LNNPFVFQTNQEEFNKEIRRTSPKDPDSFVIEMPTTGEVIALWWTTSSFGNNDEKYIPKYFKRIYRVDMTKQRKIFIQAGMLKVEDDKYQLTDIGENFLKKYDLFIKEHKESSRDPFYSIRRRIADTKLY